MGIKVKVLIDCPANRYKKGEVGELLRNDFSRYDYFVELPPIKAEIDTFCTKKGELVARNYYFFKREIEIL